MPIFEYRCQECEKQFEELVFSSREEVHCPGCKTTNVRKLVSKVSFKSQGKTSSSSAGASSSSGGCSGCSAHSCAGCH